MTPSPSRATDRLSAEQTPQRSSPARACLEVSLRPVGRGTAGNLGGRGLGRWRAPARRGVGWLCWVGCNRSWPPSLLVSPRGGATGRDWGALSTRCPIGVSAVSLVGGSLPAASQEAAGVWFRWVAGSLRDRSSTHDLTIWTQPSLGARPPS